MLLLDATTSEPFDCTVTDTDVLWVDLNSLHTTPKNAGPSTVLASHSDPNSAIGQLVRYQSTVLWTGGQSILSTDLVTGDTTVLGTGFAWIVALAQSGSYIYGTEFAYVGFGAAWRIPLAGGGAEALYNPPSDGRYHNDAGAAADAQRFYWLSDGDVVSVPKTGGTPTVLVHTGSGAAPGITCFAADFDSLYLAADDGIVQVPKSGGGFALLAATTAACNDLAVDDASVYWTQDDGRVLKVDKAGRDFPTVIAEEAERPYCVTTDDTFVYWGLFSATTGKGAVQRREK